ncbi:MAG: hypothetical protein PW735_05370 [Acidobacteriaceae bacterium]|nr:hypothetical protein [Acidobacteriaceae bacterium]
MMIKHLHSALPCFALLATAFALSGCKAKEMGQKFADQQANNIDTTWLIAANACWPDLAHQGYSVGDIKRYLGDPLHLRAAFAGYSSLTDTQLVQIVSAPVLSAPAPDTSVFHQSLNPVLTRSQALSGTRVRGTVPADNNGTAPDDALCAVQSGVPVGFK